VRLILQTARIALVEWCVYSGRECPQGIAFQVGEIVAALEAFPEAYPYFATELAALQHWWHVQPAATACLNQPLRTLATKLVY